MGTFGATALPGPSALPHAEPECVCMALHSPCAAHAGTLC